MRALVLEKQQSLALRDIDLPLEMGPRDVKIAIDTVGICGSDVHYYAHGHIGSFVVKAPMVLGHEAAGVVVDVGSEVKTLRRGDRVLHGAGSARSGLQSVEAWHVQRRPERDLLGNSANSRLPHGRGHPSGGVHLQAARQCQLRRRRPGGAVRDRDAGGVQSQDRAR